MNTYPVRIKEVTINDFMNIESGTISFVNPNDNYLMSILGLYGQNGSGKTALINALDILKYAISGSPVPSEYSECVRVGFPCSTFVYTFLIRKDDESAEEAVYTFSMAKEKTADNSSGKVIIFGEVLKTRLYREKDERMGRIIDTSVGDTVSPKSKKLLLFGKDSDRRLCDIKEAALKESRSFIFSDEIISLINFKDSDETSVFYYEIIGSLRTFGTDYLFVINTSNNALVAMNAEPLNFKIGKGGGTIAIPINGSTVFPEKELSLIKELLDRINIVLKTIIPGLHISVEDLGETTLYTGDKGVIIRLMSQRDGVKVPFSRESEGIKKLVSILQLLTAVFNNPGVTVAIDELDTSIFEYLLGEILNILSESGQGQLIFTAHNLRPLETLDKGFIAFTTTDRKNRFIRLRNIKETNNLRSLYYRNIVINDNYDNLYDVTRNHEIALAFFEAGGTNDE